MANYPKYVDANPVPSPLMPPQVKPVARPPSRQKQALLDRITRLKRQVVVSSIVAFALIVGLVSGALGSVSTWVSTQFFPTASQSSDDGNNFFNQGGSSNSGGSNVGSSGGQQPVSGSGGS